MTQAPLNRNGGLTLVPMPGFEELAVKVKKKICYISEEKGEKRTEVDIVYPEFTTRASGEPGLRLEKDHIGGHDVVVLASGPGTYEMMGQLFFILNYLVGRRAARISIAFGYFPLGRSDKDEEGTEFALPPWFIRQCMAAADNQLDRIIAVDLHAPQVVMSGRTGLITEVSMVRRLLGRAIKDAIELGDLELAILLPDGSSGKRVEKPLKKACEVHQINPPTVMIIQHRYSSLDKEIKKLFGEVDQIKGRRVIGLDDEISTGGTFFNAADMMKSEYGAASVWGLFSHGVMCGESPNRFRANHSSVERIYFTDTIPVNGRPELQPLVQEGILHVVPWSDDLGWIVYRHHWDRSVRILR